ncbi:MAG: 3-ketoacyl-ACP reductase [Lentisphaerae bacterium]|nr:3-ketoacyl-ACP reductase [Lentisphaerota bacterium]
MEKSNILITGGTRGIGAGIVRELAKNGHNVGFCGRSENAATVAFLKELQTEFPGKFAFFACDVADAAMRENMLEDFIRQFGTLDILVNNAGVAPEVRSDLLDMSSESFDRVMAINLKGPFFLSQSAAKRMIAAKDGKFRCIINIGSVSADFASINRGEYCLSKAAVAMATKLFAVRLADEHIAVYELRPGVIKSDMTSAVADKYDKMISGGLTLQKRWGMPEDIGRAVAMLADGALAYSTGQVINIDGGLAIERF